MAEPSEGAYVLINVASQKALDVQWESNKYKSWTIVNTRHSDWICQTWILDKQSNGWQITNYATWGCLDATNATWVQQLKDNNKNTQRWTVASTGETVTYGGVSYPSYTITSKSSTSKKLARVTQNSKDWGGYSSSVTNNAKWILVPANVISDNGTYYIVPANAPSKCIEIGAGSKANGAWAVVNTRKATKSYQTFSTSVNAENYAVTLINQNSGKALDIWKNDKSGKPDKVGQYTKSNSSTSQKWFITRVSGAYVKFNGVNYPAYTIRSEKSDYSNYYMTVKDGSIRMTTRVAGSTAQHFTFIPTEYLDNGLTVPGAIAKTSFNVSSGGTVIVSGLSFSSKYSKFQIRYMLKKYKVGRKKYTKTVWVSANGKSKANSGWGPAGKTIPIKPKNGIATIPENVFKPSFKLNAPKSSSDPDTVVAVDLIMEVRAFADVTKNGITFRNARSAAKQTVIKIRQTPTITVKTLSLVMGPGSNTDASDDLIGVSISLEESLKEGFASVRARLIGADSIPMSDWVSGTTKTLTFYAGQKLYRLPNQNEKVKVQYSVVTKTDKIRRSGTVTKTFSYSTSSSVQIGHAADTDGSFTEIIQVPRHEADCCFMEVDFLSGKKLIPCRYRKIVNGYVQWVAVPPLNKDARIVVYSKNKNSSAILVGETTIRRESHAFIWNWGSSAKSVPTQFATLIVNPDAPPQQKRSYTTDLQFQSPAGRILPVGFASKTLSIDLSVTGVSVDENASYVAAGPLPLHNEVKYLTLLVELAGKGIHPIYRTPYGDWHQVGVSVVDVSKNAINYSDVSITQRALED